MSVLTVSFEDLGITAATRAMIDKFPNIAGQAFYASAISIVVPAIQGVIASKNLVFRGDLLRSVRASLNILSSGPELRVGAMGSPYAEDVDQGTLPHNVDDAERANIVAWVKKKALTSNEKASDLDAARTAALIIKQIEKEGSVAHPFIEPAWELTKALFVNDAIRRMKAKLGT